MLVGIDIGGTKCALSVGEPTSDGVRILHREEFPTKDHTWPSALDEFARRIEGVFNSSTSQPSTSQPSTSQPSTSQPSTSQPSTSQPSTTQPSTSQPSTSQLLTPNSFSIGISCGGPLDSQRGLILSPPNLPGWDEVPVVKYFADRFGVPVHLQNDANACAYAEWKFGAGRGTRNMVFITFGTGFGAGLIIDGKLYSGANDNAGEIGHIRLAPAGPWGYNKEGSAEGFCSGAGMTRLAKLRAAEQGVTLPEDFSTKELFARIDKGDAFCLSVFKESAAHLGMVLSYVVDILNPELIVLGGVFMRQQERFMKEIVPIVEREALPFANKVCRITGAGLSENIGDYAALAVAMM